MSILAFKAAPLVKAAVCKRWYPSWEKIPGAKMPGDVVKVPDGRIGEVLSRVIPLGADGTRYAVDVFLFGIGKERGTSTSCWEDEVELVERRYMREISLR